MNSACYSRETMTRFLAGELPAQEESDVAYHLGRCPRCHEMAEALSVSVPALKMRLLRGREGLREKLEGLLAWDPQSRLS